jgi:hypothetical protein
MHEHLWNCLKLVSDELDRLYAFKADCARRGQSGADIQGQIDELLVRREHLQRALRISLASNAAAEAHI